MRGCITVTVVGGSTPYKQHTIPGRINFFDFDNGGEGIAYHDDSVGNTQSGTLGSHPQYRPVPSGEYWPDIGWRDAVGYMLGNAHAGEWLKYSQVTVQTTATYNVGFTLSSDRSGTMELWIDGAKAATVPYTASPTPWYVFQTFTVSVALTAGTHDFEVRHITGSVDSAWIDFSIPLNITVVAGSVTTVPSLVYVGESFQVQCQVKNNGTIAGSGYVDFYLDGALFDTQTVTNLAAGATTTKTSITRTVGDTNQHQPCADFRN